MALASLQLVSLSAATTSRIAHGKASASSRSLSVGRPALHQQVFQGGQCKQRRERGALQTVAVRTENLDVTFTTAPDFTLPEPLTGKSVTLSEFAAGAPATLVMFICNHCPFVIHLKPAITELAKEYQAKGVAVLAISSNSVETHPQDGPEAMAEDAKAQGYTFPYLFDESQDVAKAYEAACTPEFYVFDKDRRLVYHGQFDKSRPSKYGGNDPVTGEDLRNALDCALEGRENTKRIVPSIGCNIKWHPGKAPAWFHG